MAASTVPQAVQSCHELLLWLIPQLDKFPRVRRFTLGERIEAGLLAVLELLVEAALPAQQRGRVTTGQRPTGGRAAPMAPLARTESNGHSPV